MLVHFGKLQAMALEQTGILHLVSQDDLRSKRALEVALDTMPVGVSWARVSDQSIVFVNRTFKQMFGYEAGDFSSIDDWIDKAYPVAEDRDLARKKWGQYFERPDPFEFPVDPIEVCVRCSDGSEKAVMVSGIILPDTGWALATFVDITERKRGEDLLKEAQNRVLENQAIYRLLVDHSPEMIVLSPFDTSRRYASPAVEQITGFSAEEYLKLRDLEMMHEDDHGTARLVIRTLRAGNLVQTFRYRALQKGGHYRWVEAHVVGYLDLTGNDVAGYVATIRDISQQVDYERVQAQEHQTLSKAASIDELTGIANRRGFNATFERGALASEFSSRDLSILLLDVDHFKRYNDLYGHLAGDDCLRRIARALEETLHRKSDLAARYGGEEFVILLPSTPAERAEQIALAILQAVMSLVIPHEGNPGGLVSVSVGVANWPAGMALDRMTLLSRADTALYQAKNEGRNTYRIAR